MIILVHQYLLLRFLIDLFSIVFIGNKRSSEEISSESVFFSPSPEKAKILLIIFNNKRP